MDVARPDAAPGESQARSLLIRSARLVPLDAPSAATEPVDIRLRGGIVVAIGADLSMRSDEEVLDADGRWAMPGLWDQHVHMGQWSQTRFQVDLCGTENADEVVYRVREHVANLPDDDTGIVIGFGYRSGTWERAATVAQLDEAVPDRPVVLISGDVHNGWLNTSAQQLLGSRPTLGALDETEWFEVFGRLEELPTDDRLIDRAYQASAAEAAARGVVGIVDMEFGRGYAEWSDRVVAGTDRLRVRPAVYPGRLDEVLSLGLRTGQVLDGSRGLVSMGPLKIISDGSLNTRTAHCCDPYLGEEAGENPRGKQNYNEAELVDLLGRATEHGLEVAVHAIGDAAVATALDALEQTGARGSIEHAQLTRPEDAVRMARLGVRASVQPAHLLDDREITHTLWADRADRCFAFASMHAAGVRLVLGSDAPVAPLDPWLAMAAAVHRGDLGAAAWNQAEALTPALALSASTDGRGVLAAGTPADLILLDRNPLQGADGTAGAARLLREVEVHATYLAGNATHFAL